MKSETKVASNQLTIPKVDSLPIIQLPPASIPIPEEPEDNLLILATTNRLLNQAQSHSSSPRRLTIDSQNGSANNSRRQSMAGPKLSSRRHSMAINKIPLMNLLSPSRFGSKFSLEGVPVFNSAAVDAKRKNRRLGFDALSAALSALYAKLIVVLGLALPVTNILHYKGAASFYQGFYLYLYVSSLVFISFVYITYLKSRPFLKILSSDSDAQSRRQQKPVRYGSFYLRVGIVAFGIGSMVYCGLEFGQYFELKGDPECQNILIAITPATRMILTIAQIQFIFLNKKEIFMAKHQIISRFGLMHLIATNLCEWLYVIVEETKHEISHFLGKHDIASIEDIMPDPFIGFVSDAEMELLSSNHTLVRRATGSTVRIQCQRSNIMGSLIQNAAQFLFPCTIEYSLICAVILFEMWKKIQNIETIERSRRNSRRVVSKPSKSGAQLSVDCSSVNRGMFAGILVIVLTIISLIMYFVLIDKKAYAPIAILEITITEIVMYCLTTVGLIAAMVKMRDLKYIRKQDNEGMNLDCSLLAVAQSGIYIYSTFAIIGHLFSLHVEGSRIGLISEVIGIFQTSLQTLFIFNSWWRRCKGANQNRQKPGRQIITFLLVSNMAMWIVSTLAKNQAGFRPTHMLFFGPWAWTIITHVSMPLAIFYRFHSTICLFEIWKTVYKMKRYLIDV